MPSASPRFPRRRAAPCRVARADRVEMIQVGGTGARGGPRGPRRAGAQVAGLGQITASLGVRRWHSMALDGTRCQAISGDIRRYQAISGDVTRHHSTSARRPRGAEVDQGVAFDRSYVIVVTSFIHRMKYSRHRCLRDVVFRHQSALPKLVRIQALTPPNTTAL
jgi:hypothetical protein